MEKTHYDKIMSILSNQQQRMQNLIEKYAEDYPKNIHHDRSLFRYDTKISNTPIKSEAASRNNSLVAISRLETNQPITKVKSTPRKSSISNLKNIDKHTAYGLDQLPNINLKTHRRRRKLKRSQSKTKKQILQGAYVQRHLLQVKPVRITQAPTRQTSVISISEPTMVKLQQINSSSSEQGESQNLASFYQKQFTRLLRVQLQQQKNFLYLLKKEKKTEWLSNVAKMFEKHDIQISYLRTRYLYLERFDTAFFSPS